MLQEASVFGMLCTASCSAKHAPQSIREKRLELPGVPLYITMAVFAVLAAAAATSAAFAFAAFTR